MPPKRIIRRRRRPRARKIVHVRKRSHRVLGRVHKAVAESPRTETGSNKGGTHIIVGARKSGKTYFLFKKLQREFFDGDRPNEAARRHFFVIVQPSYESNTAYGDFPGLKKLFKRPYGTHYTNFDQEVSIEIQKIIRETLAKGKVPFIIIDDVGGDTYLKSGGSKTNIVNFFAIQASHFDVILWALFQRFTQAPVTLRDQADTITLFNTHSSNELRLYHDTYWGHKEMSSFKKQWFVLFRKPFDHLTIVNKKGGIREYYRNGTRVIMELL